MNVEDRGVAALALLERQLSVYLRLVGVPVPPIDGPTADEM